VLHVLKHVFPRYHSPKSRPLPSVPTLHLDDFPRLFPLGDVLQNVEEEGGELQQVNLALKWEGVDEGVSPAFKQASWLAGTGKFEEEVALWMFIPLDFYRYAVQVAVYVALLVVCI